MDGHFFPRWNGCHSFNLPNNKVMFVPQADYYFVPYVCGKSVLSSPYLRETPRTVYREQQKKKRFWRPFEGRNMKPPLLSGLKFGNMVDLPLVAHI